MKRIIHEREKCIGCGACVSVCPKYWEMSEDKKATLKESIDKGGKVFELEVEEIGCNNDAADICPVNCILIE